MMDETATLITSEVICARLLASCTFELNLHLKVY